MTDATAPSPVVRESQSGGWDTSADVVVIGSGAGGLVAAIAAAERGATVVVLEKAPTAGGTTRKSGGGSWVPNNRFMRELGLHDDRTAALRLMARTARPTDFQPDAAGYGLPAWQFTQLEAFFDDAAATFAELEQLGILEQFHLPDFPDYYSELAEDVPATGHLIVPRMPDGVGGDGRELIRQLTAALERHGGSLLTEHRVTSAIVSDDGRVVGIAADTPAGPTRIEARRGVIFATGGFTHNKELRESLLIGPIFGGGAALTNEGDFVPIAQTLGAAMRNMNQFWGCPFIIEETVAKDPMALGVSTVVGDSLLFVNRYGRRVVNEKDRYSEKVRAMFAWDGQRAEYPNLPLFAIWDQRTMDHCADNPYDGGLIVGADGDQSHMVQGETLAELAIALDAHLAKFAEVTGGARLSEDFADRLSEAIERFNGFALAGHDEDFRRGDTLIERYFHNISMGTAGVEGGQVAVAKLSVAAGASARSDEGPQESMPWAGTAGVEGSQAPPAVPSSTMYPLALEGPYYAAILVPGTLDTKGGPMTDTGGRVLDHAGRPIEGLYAVGNCAASPSGQGYWGPGCTLGLIITQAWRAGLTAAGGGD